MRPPLKKQLKKTTPKFLQKIEIKRSPAVLFESKLEFPAGHVSVREQLLASPPPVTSGRLDLLLTAAGAGAEHPEHLPRRTRLERGPERRLLVRDPQCIDVPRIEEALGLVRAQIDDRECNHHLPRHRIEVAVEHFGRDHAHDQSDVTHVIVVVPEGTLVHVRLLLDLEDVEHVPDRGDLRVHRVRRIREHDARVLELLQDAGHGLSPCVFAPPYPAPCKVSFGDVTGVARFGLSTQKSDIYLYHIL